MSTTALIRSWLHRTVDPDIYVLFISVSQSVTYTVNIACIHVHLRRAPGVTTPTSAPSSKARRIGPSPLVKATTTSTSTKRPQTASSVKAGKKPPTHPGSGKVRASHSRKILKPEYTYTCICMYGTCVCKSMWSKHCPKPKEMLHLLSSSSHPSVAMKWWWGYMCSADKLHNPDRDAWLPCIVHSL